MRQAKDFPKIYAFANHSTGIKLAELLREDDYPGMIYSGELGSQPSLLVYHIYLDEEAIPRAELLDIPTN